MAERKSTIEAAPRPFSLNLDYLLAVALGFLVPGAGHWIMGHRARAVILGALLLGTFWLGETVSGGYAVTRQEHPIFFYGQIGNGLSAIIADKLQWGDVTPRTPPSLRTKSEIDRKIPPQLTMGILLTTVSGLLNMLLVLHVMDPRSWEAARTPAPAGSPPGGRKP